MATYGEGDPTDNAQDFHEWLKSTDADLQGLRFAVRVKIRLYSDFHIFFATPGFWAGQ